MRQIFFEVYLLLSDIYRPYTIFAVKFKISLYVSVMFTICISHYRNAFNREKKSRPLQYTCLGMCYICKNRY